MNILDRSDLKTKTNLSYFQSEDIAKLGWVQHAFLTRQGGVSLPPYDSLNLSDKNGDHKECVSTNKNLIARTFGFDPSRLVLLDQMQQDQILLLKKPIATLPSPLEYDALITNFTNIYLAILTADCLPILVVDQKRKVIAAIHAGRNGTALRITTKVLTKMKEEFGCSSRDLLITLGPSIGVCCYEIDEKAFHPEWEPFSTSKGTGKWMSLRRRERGLRTSKFPGSISARIAAATFSFRTGEKAARVGNFPLLELSNVNDKSQITNSK